MGYKKKYTTKRYKKKKRSNNGFYSSYGPGKVSSLPYPPKMKFNTRYCELRRQINAGAGTAATHVFKLNGMFDPDYTGTLDHKPIGFDQVMAMYDHYTVIGARARVFFQNGENSIEQMVCLSIKDTLTTSPDLQNVIENGNCRWKTLGIKSSNSDTCELSIGFSAKKFFSRNPLTSSNLQGSLAGDPSEGAYLHVSSQALSGNDPGNMHFSIVIEYTAILTEPKLLVSS